MQVTFKEDLQTVGVTWKEERVAGDHSQWKKLITQCSTGDGRYYV